MIVFYLCIILVMIIYVRKYVIMHYLYRQYKMGIGQQYREITKEYHHCFSHNDIDEETYNDLECDDILQKINFTYTEIGNEYLYHRLFEFPDCFDQQEDIIQCLSNKKILKEVIYRLHQLNQNYIPVLTIKEHYQKITIYHALVIGLCIIGSLASLILMFQDIQYISFVMMMIFFNIMVNTKLSEQTQQLNLQISSICYMVLTVSAFMKAGLIFQSSHLNQAVKNMKSQLRLFSYFELISRFDIFGLINIFKAIFFIDFLQIFVLRKDIQQVYDDILLIYQAIGLVDTCMTVSIIRHLYKTCIPQINDKKEIIIKDGYHLLIDDPVVNSVKIDQHMMITGSNASGKSTFIKMVGINMLFAQAFHVAFASQWIYYPCHVVSLIHMKDNLLNSESYYVREIKRLEKIVDEANQYQSLILIDEILKGTNEKERLIIAKAVLKYLFQTSSQTIVTTHDISLTQGWDHVNQYCFCDIKNNQDIIFDYQLKQGVSQEGNAIAIVQSLHFPQEINDDIECFLNL